MGKIIETKINRFDGGITNDPRDTVSNVARMITNFDALTNPYRLEPYRSLETGDNDASTSKKQNFAIGYWAPTSTWRLFSLGVKSGTTKAEILMKKLDTGTNTDLSDAVWASPANNQSAVNNTNFELFVYYKKTGLFYGAEANTTIWTFDPDGATAFSSASHALVYTNIAQGLVHSKDDILYIPYDNKIAVNNNGSWTDAAITLPTHFYITSISEYGNYLAIACAPLSGVGSSRVFFWDRDSSLTTLSESIDWGQGIIKIIEEVDGELIGISICGGVQTIFKNKIVFRRYVGAGGAQKFKELTSSNSSCQLPIAKQKIGNRIYFLMSINFNGEIREGIWSVGRSNPNGNITVIHENTPNNDIALTNGILKNFIFVDDYLFISFISNSIFALSKTDDTNNYLASSIYETKKINTIDSATTKKLIGVTSITEPMPSTGSTILKYRINAETSWTTIATNSIYQNVNHDSINIESTGNNLPQYNEIEFRIESKGGVVITGLTFKEEIIDNSKY